MPTPALADLPRLALRLAELVPESVVLGVAARIETYDLLPSLAARAQIVADVAQPPYRATIGRFLDGWAASEAAALPPAAAMALRTAAYAVSALRRVVHIRVEEKGGRLPGGTTCWLRPAGGCHGSTVRHAVHRGLCSGG